MNSFRILRVGRFITVFVCPSGLYQWYGVPGTDRCDRQKQTISSPTPRKPKPNTQSKTSNAVSTTGPPLHNNQHNPRPQGPKDQKARQQKEEYPAAPSSSTTGPTPNPRPARPTTHTQDTPSPSPTYSTAPPTKASISHPQVREAISKSATSYSSDLGGWIATTL